MLELSVGILSLLSIAIAVLLFKTRNQVAVLEARIIALESAGQHPAETASKDQQAMEGKLDAVLARLELTERRLLATVRKPAVDTPPALRPQPPAPAQPAVATAVSHPGAYPPPPASVYGVPPPAQVSAPPVHTVTRPPAAAAAAAPAGSAIPPNSAAAYLEPDPAPSRTVAAAYGSAGGYSPGPYETSAATRRPDQQPPPPATQPGPRPVPDSRQAASDPPASHAPGNSASTQAAASFDRKREIVRLAQVGYTATQIAVLLTVPVSEVELLLKVLRSTPQGQNDPLGEPAQPPPPRARSVSF